MHLPCLAKDTLQSTLNFGSSFVALCIFALSLNRTISFSTLYALVLDSVTIGTFFSSLHREDKDPMGKENDVLFQPSRYSLQVRKEVYAQNKVGGFSSGRHSCITHPVV